MAWINNKENMYIIQMEGRSRALVIWGNRPNSGQNSGNQKKPNSGPPWLMAIKVNLLTCVGLSACMVAVATVFNQGREIRHFWH